MSNKYKSSEDYLLYLKITKDLFKFCLVGDGGVGKSTFINFLTSGKLATDIETKRTPYINIDGCILGGHNLQLYDLAGQRRENAHPLDHMQNVILKSVDYILFFFSLENMQSFLNIKNWYEEIQLFYKNFQTEKPKFFLIGNKSDLPRKVEKFNGEQLINRINDFIGYYEISLVTGDNVTEFLKDLCNYLDQRYQSLNPEDFKNMKIDLE